MHTLKAQTSAPLVSVGSLFLTWRKSIKHWQVSLACPHQHPVTSWDGTFSAGPAFTVCCFLGFCSHCLHACGFFLLCFSQCPLPVPSLLRKLFTVTLGFSIYKLLFCIWGTCCSYHSFLLLLKADTPASPPASQSLQGKYLHFLCNIKASEIISVGNYPTCKYFSTTQQSFINLGSSWKTGLLHAIAKQTWRRELKAPLE